MISTSVGAYYTTKTATFPVNDERCKRSVNQFGTLAWTLDLSENMEVESSPVMEGPRRWMTSYSWGEFYTAETATFPLTDFRCEKPLGEFAVWNWNLDCVLHVEAEDFRTLERTLTFLESVSSEDVIWHSTVIKIKDGADVRDVLSRAAAKLLIDGAGAADILSNRPGKTLKESVASSDWRNAGFVVLLKDGMEISDPLRFETVWERLWKEHSTVREKTYRSPVLPFREGISAGDWINREAGKNLFEYVGPSDRLYRPVMWTRVWEESVGTDDHEYAKYTAAYYETTRMLDQIVHGPNGVLYDVSFQEGPISREDFEEIVSSPSGYSTFVDFRVGDYEYKDAIYRFMVQKQELSVNPLLYDLVVHVDIPDTEDRGTANVSAETTRVYFNKSFYNPPEVVATTVSGTTSGGVSIPVVLSTDKSDDAGRYFEVQLQNADGSLVSGRIAWTARGY